MTAKGLYIIVRKNQSEIWDGYMWRDRDRTEYVYGPRYAKEIVDRFPGAEILKADFSGSGRYRRK